MSGAFLISYLVLWIVVFVLALLVLVLYRQMGEMYLGTKEARLRDGIALGARAPQFDARDVLGREVRVPPTTASLIAFVSPDCGPCQSLMPELRKFEVERRDIQIILLGSDDHGRDLAFAGQFRLSAPLISQERMQLSAKYRVRQTPFVFYLDPDGVVRAKGIVNRLSQIRQLVERGEKLTPATGPRETTPQEAVT